jgi:hypothetical protein
MKKSEDIKRHSEEGKTALKRGKWIKVSLFLFLILSEIVNSQIPVNGFCVQNSYQIPAGYEKILSADLNKDQTDEFIVYSSSFKKIGIISFVKNRIIDFKEFPVDYEFSQIKYLNDINSINNRFVCVSRKNRLIAVYEIELNSFPVLKSKITFDSYPENISLGDINNDRIFEVLVSGIGFDGLSILMRREGRLAENKIISGESFNQAVFADLSNDGYADVTAFNIINNSTQFFYNDTNVKFKLVRNTKTTKKIELLNSCDINNDDLHDLIFNYGTDLDVIYGDFQSTYEKKKSLQLKNKPYALQLSDFNSDSLTDIAYINLETGNINVLFAKSGSEFYDEITYTKLPSVSCISNFNQKKHNNLIILSKDGFVTTISSYKNDLNFNEVIPAINAGTLQKFDLNIDGISDICFIDKSDNTFRILTRNSNGIFSDLYLQQLAESHQSIVVDDFFKASKTFYCYSKENQLVEFLKINFKTNKVKHKHLYSPGKIKDLTIQRVDSSLVNIYLLYVKGNKLFLGKFEHRDFSITFREYPFIDRDVICAELFLDKEIRAFYWKEKSDSLFFNEVVVKTGPNSYYGILGFSKGDSIKISLTASNQLYGGKPWIVSLIRNDNKNLLVSFKENGYKKLQLLNETSKINYFKNDEFTFAKLQDDENESLLVYSPYSKSLNKVSISKDGINYSLKQIVDGVDINNYFFDKFNRTNNHLVYSDKEKGCISVLQLKK